MKTDLDYIIEQVNKFRTINPNGVINNSILYNLLTEARILRDNDSKKETIIFNDEVPIENKSKKIVKESSPPIAFSNEVVIPVLGLIDVFPFGKHKGEALANVLHFNPQYILWADREVDKFKIEAKIVRDAESKSTELSNPKGGFKRKDLYDDDDLPF